jgi:hypothetical protein
VTTSYFNDREGSNEPTFGEEEREKEEEKGKDVIVSPRSH